VINDKISFNKTGLNQHDQAIGLIKDTSAENVHEMNKANE